jgi:TetR/AcrR family transcriptional regulator, transcriptional repressor for nem operon
MNVTRERLLGAAMELFQTRGYNGFSFHDLAAVVGIKTASIHYHFPTKGDLAVSLAQRYRAEFLIALGEPAEQSTPEQINRYVDLFRSTLQSGRFCLCGMMAAEVEELPAKAKAELALFFEDNRAWLTAVLTAGGRNERESDGLAALTVAALEGALLMSRAGDALAAFDGVADALRPILLPATGLRTIA